MKKIVCILIGLCCLVCNSFAEHLRLRYEGARLYSYGNKDYDPSGGIIDVDLDNKKIKIYTGPYNVLFGSSPIYYESVHGASISRESSKDKCLYFKGTYTCKGEECNFFINLDKKKASFSTGEDFSFVIEFEDLVNIDTK